MKFYNLSWTIYGPERNLDKSSKFSVFLSSCSWVAERQRIDDSRRAARGFSVNKFETNRSEDTSTSAKLTLSVLDLTEEKNTNLAHQNLDLLCFSADQPLFWKGQGCGILRH